MPPGVRPAGFRERPDASLAQHGCVAAQRHAGTTLTLYYICYIYIEPEVGPLHKWSCRLIQRSCARRGFLSTQSSQAFPRKKTAKNDAGDTRDFLNVLMDLSIPPENTSDSKGMGPFRTVQLDSQSVVGAAPPGRFHLTKLPLV
eukprot:552991-Pyramimonas_sp.AAC.2